MGFSDVRIARNHLVRACLDLVSGDMYDDDYPERDASGGEASAMRDEKLQETARNYIKAVDADRADPPLAGGPEDPAP